MRNRQITFREMGGTAYGKAQQVAFALRSTGFEAVQGFISSPSGAWADTVYVMTDAPLPNVRKIATAEGLRIAQ